MTLPLTALDEAADAGRWEQTLVVMEVPESDGTGARSLLAWRRVRLEGDRFESTAWTLLDGATAVEAPERPPWRRARTLFVCRVPFVVDRP